MNLPNEKEREAIFKVHLGKRGHKDLKIDNVLVKATDGFNGADIESVVNEAVEEVFVKNLDGKNDTLTSSVLLDKAKNTISISKSCKKQIDNMKKAFAESNFKDASKV